MAPKFDDMPTVVIKQGRIDDAPTVAANGTVDNVPKTVIFVPQDPACYSE